LTLTEKDLQEAFQNGGDGRTGVYMREGTTLRAMVADRPYGEFYDFYCFSPEYFGYTLVLHIARRLTVKCNQYLLMTQVKSHLISSSFFIAYVGKSSQIASLSVGCCWCSTVGIYIVM
jgi:hypothetical protein